MSGEKRSQNWEDSDHAETAIIVDVEGTTSSISFVKDTLFPYVREHLKEYVEKNWDIDEFKGDLEKLKEQAQKDESDKVEGFIAIKGSTPEEERESLIKNVLWQMDADRKTGALKQLQGHIWREAFNSGSIKGHVYEDVPKAFEEWTNAERKIYVYSSGSVEAQKLLFAHSEHGDMTKYFTDHFDTEVGPKQQSSSYKNILEKINAEPSSVIFLTDVAKEAAAAKEAGINAKLVVRPGNEPITDEDKVIFTSISSFLDLSFQTSAKRKRVEKSEEKEAAKEKSSAPEAMDTSESPVTNAPEKCAEKSEAAETTPETAKIEKTEIPEKSDQASMDVDNKDETEKKNTEAVDKPPVPVEQTDKQEEESKTSEKKSEDVKEEASPRKDVTTNDLETSTNKDSATPQSEVTKEVEEAAKREDSGQISEKEAREETTVASEPSTESRSEPMDEQLHSLPSKNEATVTTKITEEKTEVSEKPVEPCKTEKNVETEASVSTESTAATTISESKTENETEVKSSSANSESSIDAAPEVNLEKKDEKEERETKLEKKTEQQDVPASKTVEPVVETVAQCPDKEENKKEEVKQNGESKEVVQSTENKEKNGDLKEEKEVVVAAAAAPVETAKEEASPLEKQQEKPEEKLEGDKKEKETVEAKTGESPEGKLNGSLETTETAEKTEAHRNGLNGDSLSEKSNGESQKEAATSSNSQNGQTETLSPESIKSKKVVDSTIAEGATVEPDVVPPVPVAATS